MEPGIQPQDAGIVVQDEQVALLHCVINGWGLEWLMSENSCGSDKQGDAQVSQLHPPALPKWRHRKVPPDSL